MVVDFEVTFPGPVGRFERLASTIAPTEEHPEGIDQEILGGHIIGYLRACGLSSRYLTCDMVITADEGSGTIYQGATRRIGGFRLRRMEVGKGA